jgi:hypothetical protein
MNQVDKKTADQMMVSRFNATRNQIRDKVLTCKLIF